MSQAAALSRRSRPVRTLSELSSTIATAYARIERDQYRNCWIHVRPKEEALAEADALARRAAQGEFLPLLGVPFGVKDNIDVAGMPTTAACPSFAHVAERSARCVERLVAAGAICIGKTNLDQFATGLSGARSPHGTCPSVADDGYISGGSSSGSAVAVAAGHVAFSLGTDTGGSGRVPAGFNGIIGIKPTVGLVSSRGLVPNCPTLDCPSIFCNSVSEGRLLLELIEGFDEEDPYSREARDPSSAVPPEFRFGRISAPQLDSFGSPECDGLYEQACERLVGLGGKAREIDFKPFAEAGEMLFSGPWIAERYAAISRLFDIDHGHLLEVTRKVLHCAAEFTAADAFAAQHRLLQLRRQVRQLFEQIDVLIVPTAPRPFTIAEMLEDPVTLNTRLGHYSYAVNLLDLCAVALPNATLAGGMPMGVTLLAPAWHDHALLDFASRWQRDNGAALFGLNVYSRARARA
ncbi:allophanate hydrolase [Bradyrhizobium sp. Gha]|uniref:allophanate hydrolase n=1 Tax=Bradyrhizobium sp. Gha TaxID=1855318 RepID=UPI0008F27B10|nr:allophanate hydrolase [Bradyrhizobium sp. Gha]SFJ03801.1 amidase/allophanate hydrolase [Bradyrhizobium sp. Gha]